MALCMDACADILGEAVVLWIDEFRVSVHARPQIEQCCMAVYPVNLALAGDAFVLARADQAIEARVSQQAVAPMVYRLVHRCFRRIGTVPDAIAAIAVAAGRELAEWEFDGLHPCRFFEWTTYDRHGGCVGRRLRIELRLLRDGPIFGIVGKVVEEFL